MKIGTDEDPVMASSFEEYYKLCQNDIINELFRLRIDKSYAESLPEYKRKRVVKRYEELIDFLEDKLSKLS